MKEASALRARDEEPSRETERLRNVSLEKTTREPHREFLVGQRKAPFSYAEVGASQEGISIAGRHAVDYNRVWLGEGEDAFVRASEALRRWKMFDLGWVSIRPPEVLFEVGATVAVLGHHYGFWRGLVTRSAGRYKSGSPRTRSERWGGP